MLGLADRGRVLDLFETLMGGKIADALRDLGQLYDHGADPLAVMQDLLEIVHFLTRVKVAPGAEGFFDGGSGEARRAADMAARLSVPSLTRAWQVLLKGLLEVRDATRPVAACEMALIRLAYAADLPPTDKLVRDLLDNPPLEGGSKSASAAQQISGRGPTAAANPSPKMPSAFATPAARPDAVARTPQGEGGKGLAPKIEASAAPQVQAALAAGRHRAARTDLEPQGESRAQRPPCAHGTGPHRNPPHARAPTTLAGDLSQKLFALTGQRWSISISREAGQPTLAEQKRDAKAAKFEKRDAGAPGARGARPLSRRRDQGSPPPRRRDVAAPTPEDDA